MTKVSTRGQHARMSRRDESRAVDEFLAVVEDARQGWSAQWGGPKGVARHCGKFFDELRAVQARISDIRAAAVDEMLRTRSGGEVAGLLGVSKSALSKIRRREPTEIAW